jgi:hypothetical protein
LQLSRFFILFGGNLVGREFQPQMVYPIKKAPGYWGAFEKGAATYSPAFGSTICAGGLIRRGGSKWAKPNIY